MMSASPSTVIGSRYLLLDSFSGGNMGVVYRARDLLTGEMVALKRVEFLLNPAQLGSSHSSLDLRAALAREFRVLASLRHPNIISVLDYGFDAQRYPYFTMEYLEGARSVVTYAATQPEMRLRLLREMIEALAYLHRHGVLHCDLKPDNVLTGVDGSARLLDFGLATAREFLSQGQGDIYGTLPYAAPELFDLQPNSIASDLYALGVIAYEILTAHYPFNLGDSLDELIDSIRHDPVAFERIEDAGLRAFVARLMERDPAARFASADEALAHLLALTGEAARETPTLRESLLQGARFVGREAELNALNAALDAAANGHGAAWLVGGESGVGKSRLIDELRIRALVRGVRVLRGGATTEEDTPYSTWRDILRGLALTASLDDFEAGVLKGILPDLESIIGRAVPDAPVIAPGAAQERALLVIEGLLHRQEQPLLLVLEDLHWAREGMTLLRRILPLVETLPILIVGTFRDDERPALPSELSPMSVLTLRRFSQAEIAALSTAILGEGAGARPELIDLLLRETEGNVFFIVQVLRALAEEAGELLALGETDLPERVTAGGVQAVIERRLGRISESDRALLEVAAVAGRAVDLALMRAIAPQIDLDQWLLNCGAVLEISDNQWRFAHDKLRETVLSRLPADQRPALHRLIAEAIEVVYAGAPDKVIVLAYHWGQAGDRAREAHYTALGGEQFLRQGSYLEARDWLVRADALSEGLGWAATRRAHLMRLRADALLGAGNPLGCIDALRGALTLLDIPLPDRADTQVSGETPKAVDAMLARVGVPLGGKRRLERDALRVVIEAELDLGYHYPEQTVDPLAGLVYVFSAAARLEKGGESPQLAYSYAMLAFALMTGGIPELAAEYAERASALLSKLNDDADPNTAAALSSLGYYWTFSARWAESARDGLHAAGLYQRTGDLLRWRATLMNLAANEEWRGNLRAGMAYRQQEWAIAIRAQSMVGEVRALAGIGQMQAMLGENEAALATFIRRRELVERVGNTASTRWTYLAMGHYRLGDLETARAYLPRAAEEISRIITTSAHDMFAITNTADVALGLWELGDESARPVAEAVERLLIDYSRRFLSGRPLMLVLIGRCDWLRGDHAGAMRRWREAIALAEQIGTRHAWALAHEQIGRHLDDAGEGMEHLQIARLAFVEMDALYDARRITAV
jgi:tetratricopeptide (TPR) repeat protein